jgi:hypothetical protein
MLKEGRPGLTEEQKVDMSRRWKVGYSIREICQALKRNSSPVYQQLANAEASLHLGASGQLC